MAESETYDADDVRMSIGDHLDELRRRVIWSLSGVAVAIAVMLYFGLEIVALLCQPMINMLAAKGFSPTLYQSTVTEAFAAYLKVSIVGGLLVAAPWIFYHAWRFISVGMYNAERKVVVTLVPFSAVMSVLGAGFMYYIMLPICLWFFISFAGRFPAPEDASPSWLINVLEKQQQVWSPSTDGPEDAGPPEKPANNTTPTPAAPLVMPTRDMDPTDPVEGQVWLKQPENDLKVFVGGHVLSFAPTSVQQSMMHPIFSISRYIGFVSMLTLGIVVAFQTPVALMILGWTGLVDPRWLARYRGYCVFGCFVLGMVLTPSDPVSMIVLALPLWGLFELGMLLMRMVYPAKPVRDTE